jgi:hypothetical protein
METKKSNKFYASCQCCNYETTKPSKWIIHIESQKHKNNGKPKETKCDKCDYTASTHWLLKQHILSQHSTKEDRAKHKLYCDKCDLVFFSNIYYEKHMGGKKHKNMIIALNLLQNNGGITDI